ncbi:MAG: YARHG domain-containing protein [Cyclobacteriaceae bacterium]
MKKLIFSTCLIIVQITLFGQKLDTKFQEYIGDRNDSYYFFQYGDGRGLLKPSLLEYALNEEKIFKLKSSEGWTKDKGGTPIYDSENIRIFKNGLNKIRIVLNEKDSSYNVRSLYKFSLASVPNSDTVFISAHSEAPIYLFNKKTFEFTPLPLTGSNLYVRGEYLFFEAPRYSDNYSSFPNDVYRARLVDLKNPEKVLIQVNKWYPYTENVLYASTDPFLRLDGEQTNGFYNLNDQRVAKSDGIATQNVIEVNEKPYLLNKNKELMRLTPLPNLPDRFRYSIEETDNQLPRGNIFQWYNIPLKEKTLPGTFITHDLLFKASRTELEELSEDQLRRLRNTFFAFQGYKFKSDDLNEFFNQFEWYQKMTMGDRTNEGIVIWPDEKDRVALIHGVEAGK